MAALRSPFRRDDGHAVSAFRGRFGRVRRHAVHDGTRGPLGGVAAGTDHLLVVRDPQGGAVEVRPRLGRHVDPQDARKPGRRGGRRSPSARTGTNDDSIRAPISGSAYTCRSISRQGRHHGVETESRSGVPSRSASANAAGPEARHATAVSTGASMWFSRAPPGESPSITLRNRGGQKGF